MSLRKRIHAHCLVLLNQKIQGLEKILSDLHDSATSDTKSSAGDKHETARAMVQIEQETIRKQLKDVQEQKAQLEKLEAHLNISKISAGSLIKTSRGYLYLSIALGKILVEKKIIIVISPQSPIGIKLVGLNVNNSTEINGVEYRIEGIE